MGDTGTPAHQRRPRKEVVRLGREIYRRDILPQVEAGHFGEYVAIDVESGDWAVADTTRVAVERLREQHPDAVDFCASGSATGRSAASGPALCGGPGDPG